MKSIIITLAIALTCLSCSKSNVTPVYNIENTRWTMAGDTTFHIAFTTDSMKWTWPALVPNPSTTYYSKLTRDSIAVPVLSVKYVTTITKDSLRLLNTKNGVTTTFYRY